MGLIRACSGQEVVDKIIGVGTVTDGGNLLLPALTKLNGDIETEASGSTYYEHVCYCTMVVDGMLHLFGFVTNIAKATKGNIFKIGNLVNTRGISPEQWQEITDNAQVITGIDPDTFSIDEATGIISGATYAPFVVGKQYKVVDTYRHAYSDLGDVLFLVFEEATVNEEHNVSAVYDAVQELDVESPEVQQARANLAQAITAKGVTTAEDASMQTMAENVRNINQVNTVFDADAYSEVVAPSELMYDIIKAGLENVRGDYSTLMVGEFYKGAYESIALSGADAYLTSDGHFYDYNTTHVWDEDSHINRYVIYYFREDGVDFNTIDGICPRKVFVIGHLGAFICATEGRVTVFYKSEGSTIKDIRFLAGNVWQENVLVDIEEHTSGYIAYKNNGIVNLTIKVKDINSSIVVIGDTNMITDINILTSSPLKSLLIDSRPTQDRTVNVSIDTIVVDTPGIANGGIVKQEYRCGERLVKKIKVVSAKFIYNEGCVANIGYHCFRDLKTIIANDVEIIYDGGSIIRGNFASGVTFCYIETISLKSLRYCYGRILFPANEYRGAILYNLIDLEVGELETNLDMRYWNPTTVFSSLDGIATINANIRDHIAAKVSDRTGQTALTFTVSTDLYNNLEPETIAAFTAKNWNVGA